MDIKVLRHLVYHELLIISEPAAYSEAQAIIAENKLADAADVKSVRAALQKLLLLKIVSNSGHAASFIYERFGDLIFFVPGFYRNRNGDPRLNIGNNSAVLPFFLPNNLIGGCVVFPLSRCGYYLLSSSRYGGPSAARLPRDLAAWLAS
jgi:hypothetical protein